MAKSSLPLLDDPVVSTSDLVEVRTSAASTVVCICDSITNNIIAGSGQRVPDKERSVEHPERI